MLQALVESQFVPPLLERRLHTDFGSGRLFYDDELDVASGLEHARAVHYLADCLYRVAQRSGLECLVDNPVWYWSDPSCRLQQSYFSDICLLCSDDPYRATADEVILVMEVVTTTDARKERKDTVISKERNARHGVREFVLYYPGPDDGRSLVWFRLESKSGRYREVPPGKGGIYRSTSVPGLKMRVLPREEWRGCIKVEVCFKSRRLESSDELEAKFESQSKKTRLVESIAKWEKNKNRQYKSQAKEAGRKAKEAEKKARKSEERVKEVENKARQSEERVREAVNKARQSEERVREAENKARNPIHDVLEISGLTMEDLQKLREPALQES